MAEMIFSLHLAILWVFVYRVSATPISDTSIEKIASPVSRNEAGRFGNKD